MARYKEYLTKYYPVKLNLDEVQYAFGKYGSTFVKMTDGTEFELMTNYENFSKDL